MHHFSTEELQRRALAAQRRQANWSGLYPYRECRNCFDQIHVGGRDLCDECAVTDDENKADKALTEQNKEFAGRWSDGRWLGFVLIVLMVNVLMALVSNARAAPLQWHVQVPPPKYDYPFPGRIIDERMPFAEVLRSRCQESWDITEKTGPAMACSWHFPDPRAPSKQACHIIHPLEEAGVWNAQDDIWSLRVENANCNGWHDELYSRMFLYSKYARNPVEIHNRITRAPRETSLGGK